MMKDREGERGVLETGASALKRRLGGVWEAGGETRRARESDERSVKRDE